MMQSKIQLRVMIKEHDDDETQLETPLKSKKAGGGINNAEISIKLT